MEFSASSTSLLTFLLTFLAGRHGRVKARDCLYCGSIVQSVIQRSGQGKIGPPHQCCEAHRSRGFGRQFHGAQRQFRFPAGKPKVRIPVLGEPTLIQLPASGVHWTTWQPQLPRADTASGSALSPGSGGGRRRHPLARKICHAPSRGSTPPRTLSFTDRQRLAEVTRTATPEYPSEREGYSHRRGLLACPQHHKHHGLMVFRWRSGWLTACLPERGACAPGSPVPPPRMPRTY